MSTATIGKFIEDGHSFKLDINRLIATRLVVQANSGGGKTWLLRKLIEECHGKVQIIVLDIEGDFSTLREKFDFILAGKGGDIAADPRYAEQLAHKILELKADLIADLYELKPHERIRFVKTFFEAMVNAPKELWHPVIVILDEAHIFAPEKSSAESLAAVADLESRGRKRGYCLVVATQRPAKIDKDVVAECQNKLIGLGNTDADRERGARELGFTDKRMILAMRDLEPGQFYAVGPAFSRRGASLIQAGAVQTTHLDSGTGRVKVHTPAPTDKVKKVLSKLVDLPKEAEEELRDRESLRKRVRELERELKTQPKAEMDERQVKLETDRIRREYENRFTTLRTNLIESVRDVVAKYKNTADTALGVTIPRQSSVAHVPRVVTTRVKTIEPTEVDGRTFGQCERKILGFLLMKEGQSFSSTQVGAMTGYSSGSGGFNNARSNLSKAGLILYQSGRMTINPNAIDQARDIVGSETPHTLEDWINKLGKCERAIYELLLTDPNIALTKDEIGDRTGYSSGSGGFNNAISHLNTLGLIMRNHDGTLQLNAEILEI